MWWPEDNGVGGSYIAEALITTRDLRTGDPELEPDPVAVAAADAVEALMTAHPNIVAVVYRDTSSSSWADFIVEKEEDGQ